MSEVMVEKQLKQTGAKINFPEEESMLKAWENMHRPPGPDHVISPSGPVLASILTPHPQGGRQEVQRDQHAPDHKA